ncbi:phosphodiester glycosidase family protein [Lacibacter sp. MH-610]|uniref:phosphodiester glycosidase family protein n=1 Tax=Lacibacter sp. MH-610 TaxID=3020883 RepID=UPI0038913BAB
MTGIKKIVTGVMLFFSISPFCLAQLRWVNVDSLYAPLPSSIHVYKTTDSVDGKPNIAFYVIADLNDKRLDFTVDTTRNRRITPSAFYERNQQPLLVVNCTFFSFETNNSINVVVKDGKMVNYNIHTIPLRGKDTFMYAHPFRSAIGINKKRAADIGWVYADTSKRIPFISQSSRNYYKDSFHVFKYVIQSIRCSNALHQNPLKKKSYERVFKKWKVETAVGGGPVLLQNGQIQITNNEEMMFAGKAKENLEPRTAMGYTADGKLIILMVQGRYPGVAEGMSLPQMAKLFQDLGCVEALNLDGGGSSCMLVNGKETITPSSKGEQRPVPAVFIIQQKKK